jgi:UDP-glucose 4-epimerase
MNSLIEPRRTVLVIGGAGYIGSHMVAALVAAGREVIVLDNLSTGHRDLLNPSVPFIQGDCGDRGLVEPLLRDNRIGSVMHFAASSLVGESMQHPLKYYRNNVAQTIELLAAMQSCGVNRFVLSSTAAVYGEPRSVPIDESHPTQPTNPYGSTKAVLERLLAEVDQSSDLRYMSLRYFNAAGAHPEGNIGERHDPESHLIPIMMQVALGRREHAQVYGTDWPTEDGSCIRDYIHVCDLAEAHLVALQALEAGRPSAIYNLGPGRGYSVLQVIDAIRRATGHPIPVVVSERRAGDPAVLVANAERVNRELGWSPRLSDLDTIVATAWNWHTRDERPAGARS